MQTDEQTKLAAALLRERSRDALRKQLQSAASDLDPDALLGLLADLLLTLGSDVDRLKLRVEQLVAERYRPRSERSTQAQLALFAEILAGLESPPTDAGGPVASDADAAKPVADIVRQTNDEIEQLRAQERERKRADQLARRAAKEAAKQAGHPAGAVEGENWPAHLPQRHIEVPVAPEDCVCPDCREQRVRIGEERSWYLDRRVVCEVVVLHRPILACPRRHGAPVAAPVPPKPVDKGHMGFGLAAWAIHLRFGHNLPIARVSEILANEGYPVSEAMLHKLYSVTAKRLGPVIEALQVEIRRAKLINLDDTPVLVLDPEHPKKRKQGRIWLALGDGRYAWYFATPNWTEAAAAKRLGDFKGVLQGDGYKGFAKMARTQRRRLAGCMAHLRRKLCKALDAKDPRAAEAIALINAMYAIERLAKLRGLDAEATVTLRQARSAPLMAALERWAATVASSVEPGSPLGKAWTYLKNQLKPLKTFLEDGNVSIDNNAAERGLRRITIGKKLWLFFRGDVTVERAAVLGSVLMTARLHGAEPLVYLEWLLREVARRDWSVNAAAALLPDAWVALQKQGGQEAAA